MRSSDGGLRLEESLQRLDETPPLRERVHAQLEELITTGAFPPGARLVEGDLADRLGVSRGPVRETLQVLSRDGFVDLRPRQGAFVHTPTAREIDDFFEVRGPLEREAALLAAQRITPEGIERLERCLADAREMLERGEDPSSVRDVAHRVDLHDELALAADNPLLTQMLTTLNKRWVWYQPKFDPALRRQAWDEHEVIVKAIIGKNAKAAAKAMDAHTARSWESTRAQERD